MIKRQPNGFDLLGWLIAVIVKWVRRHPYLSASLAIHCLLIVLAVLYIQNISNQNAVAAVQEAVTESQQNAQQADMQNRLQTLERVKQLLEQSAGRTAENLQPATATTPDQLPTTPTQLLAQATATTEAIQALTNDIRAEELAKLLNISKAEAQQKVAQSAVTTGPKPTSDQPAAVAAQLEQLEAKALSMLAARKQEVAAAKRGTQVALANKAPNESPTGDQGDPASATHSADHENSQGGNQAAVDGTSIGHQGYYPPSQDGRKQAAQNEFLVEATYTMPEGPRVEGNEHPTPLISGTEIKKMGRILGDGGEFAERIYLNSWYVIGPFAGNSGEALYQNPRYPPEQLVDLNAVYLGKDRRILRWQYLSSGIYPFIPPDPAENAVYYGYTEVSVTTATDLWMWCGADDDMQVWLNQRLAWAGGNVAKRAFWDAIYVTRNNHSSQWNLTEGKRQIHLQSGRNKLLFKLSNGPNTLGIFASIILTK